MMPRMRRLVPCLLLAVVACKKPDAAAKVASLDAGPVPPPAAAEPATITVAAASDLTFAFAEVGKAFEAKTGNKVTFSFGSTGQLARQLGEGAPFDVFAAANVAFVDEAVAEGACDGASKALYARGKIVIWGKAGGPVTATTQLADLKDKKFVKIAIAQPEHAPYGKAAKQALEGAGLWKAVEAKIVYGENIKQTMQFAQTGNAEAAIVALSLAIVDKEGVYAPIDPAAHGPLDQALVVCSHGKNTGGGKAFTAFVGSDEGKAIMAKFGFSLPAATEGPAAPAATK
jgi:molybdate transport system substrate-binding protein